MTGIVTFECQVLAGFATVEWVMLDSEEAAVEWAQAHLSPLITQVTIEASRPGHVSTFAIRHLHPDGHDSGWSCWLDGDKVSTRSLDVLFAERPARLFSQHQVS